MSRSTSRRAWRVSRLLSVMSFSANGRSSFAFIRVVVILSCPNSDVERLRSTARRWDDVRPSLRPWTRCFMERSPRAFRLAAGLELPGVDRHAERESHLGEDVLDLVERLAAEVLGLEHLGLGLGHEIVA